MKRLIASDDSGIINTTVLGYFGIEYSGSKNSEEIDFFTEKYLLKFMLRHLRIKYPEAEARSVNLFVTCVVRYIMQVAPQISLALTEDEPSLRIWRTVVEGIRDNLTKAHAGSSRSNEELFAVITEQTLAQLEKLFF